MSTNSKKRSIDEIDGTESGPPTKKQKLNKADTEPKPSNNFASCAMDPNLRKELEEIGLICFVLFVTDCVAMTHFVCVRLL